MWLFLIDKIGVEAKLLVFGSAQWFFDVSLLLFKLDIALDGHLDFLVKIIVEFVLA